MTPSRFRWGMLLIFIGVIFLIANMDRDSLIYAEALIYLIPIFLVTLGIEKIFTGSRLQFISYLSTVAFVAFGLYLVYQSTGGSEIVRYDREADYRFQYDEAVDIIQATLQMDEVNLRVRTAGNDLMYARVEGGPVRPTVDVVTNQDRASAAVRSRPAQLSRDFFGGSIGIISDYEPADWRLEFNAEIPLELDGRFTDSDIHLSFRDNFVRELRLDASDCDVYLLIGDKQPVVTVTLFGDNSIWRLRFPEGAGLLVDGLDDEAYFGQIGMSRSEDGVFVNDAYETADQRVVLELDDRHSSLEIEFY